MCYDTVRTELCNPWIHSRNTQCIVDLERGPYVPHTKNAFTHKEATVETWNSLDVRMDGRTDWQAGGLPSLHAWEHQTPVLCLLLCWSAGSRIQVTCCVFSVCPTFFRSLFLSSQVFRPSLVACTLFLSSFPRVSVQLLVWTSVYVVSQPKASRIPHLCLSEVRIHCASFAAAQDWVRICMRGHLVQHAVIYAVTSSVSHHNFSAKYTYLRYK